MDWGKIRDDYISGGITYRQLAKKYNVPLKTLGKRGKTEKWVELRQQVADRSATLAAESTAQAKADMAARVYDAAGRLLDKALETLEAAKTAKDIRALTAAVRDIREIVGIKSEADVEEQQARIDKLRAEVQRSEQDNSSLITIELGGAEQWAQ